MENSKEMYKQKSKYTFSNQASVYDSTYNGKHANKLYKRVVEKANNLNSKNILDVGCGTGTILSQLSKNECICLSGIDLSEEMIKIAKQRLSNKIELKVGDSEQLPWGNRTFDAVICTDSFHHYPEPEKVLSEMKRVLKPNGHLIIGDPWMITPLRQITNLLLKYSNSGDYRIYSQAKIGNLLLKSGFISVKWDRVNYNSFIVTADVYK